MQNKIKFLRENFFSVWMIFFLNFFPMLLKIFAQDFSIFCHIPTTKFATEIITNNFFFSLIAKVFFFVFCYVFSGYTILVSSLLVCNFLFLCLFFCDSYKGFKICVYLIFFFCSIGSSVVIPVIKTLGPKNIKNFYIITNILPPILCFFCIIIFKSNKWIYIFPFFSLIFFLGSLVFITRNSFKNQKFIINKPRFYFDYNLLFVCIATTWGIVLKTLLITWFCIGKNSGQNIFFSLSADLLAGLLTNWTRKYNKFKLFSFFLVLISVFLKSNWIFFFSLFFISFEFSLMQTEIQEKFFMNKNNYRFTPVIGIIKNIFCFLFIKLGFLLHLNPGFFFILFFIVWFSYVKSKHWMKESSFNSLN